MFFTEDMELETNWTLDLISDDDVIQAQLSHLEDVSKKIKGDQPRRLLPLYLFISKPIDRSVLVVKCF